MSVPYSISKNSATADGTQTSFPFTFKVLTSSQIKVYCNSEICPVSLYSVSLSEDSDNPGGTVIFSSAPANGAKISIVRNMSFNQNTVIRGQSNFYPEVLEDEYDDIVMQIQQLNEMLNRAIVMPPDGIVPADFVNTMETLYLSTLAAESGAVSAKEAAQTAQTACETVLGSLQTVEQLLEEVNA